MEFDELYQEIILDHYRSPRNKNPLPDISEEQVHENPACGDSVKIDVQLDDNNRVIKVSFDGAGCAIHTASTSMMTELLEGKSYNEARDIIHRFLRILRGEESADQLDEWGDLSCLKHVVNYPVRIKCATLGWNAVNQVLESKGE